MLLWQTLKIKISNKSKYIIFKYTFLGLHNFNMILEPLDKQHAKFAGIGYFSGDKIRRENENGRIYMYWSGLKLEKL